MGAGVAGAFQKKSGGALWGSHGREPEQKLDLVHIFLPKSLTADQSYKCPLVLKSVMTFYIYLKKWYGFDQVCRIV